MCHQQPLPIGRWDVGWRRFVLYTGMRLVKHWWHDVPCGKYSGTSDRSEYVSTWQQSLWKDCCPGFHPSSHATCLSVVSTPTPSQPRSSRRPSPYRPRKQKKLQIGHPCTLPTSSLSSLCLSVLYTSDVTTSKRKFHNFHQFNHVAWFYHAPNISPAIYTQCLTISSRPPTVSLHVHQSSRVVVLCPEPNKGLEVWSPTGLAITPHRVAPKRWQLWSKIIIPFVLPICKDPNKT